MCKADCEFCDWVIKNMFDDYSSIFGYQLIGVPYMADIVIWNIKQSNDLYECH